MSSISKEEYLNSLSSKLNIELSKEQLDSFLKYYELLIDWNEKINLTAITEYEDVCLKHFVDSMSIVNAFSSYDEALEFFKDKTLIDVGTGAGFPGVCLKILFPELNITLMDSLDKRIKFLNEVIAALNLKKITTVHARVEDAAKTSEYRESFDFATARAVASLPVLSEYCLPFVKVGGSFIAYKSEKVLEEISISANALNVLGGKIESKFSFDLPDSRLARTILFIKKDSSTPDKYPRKAGTPSKKPL
ncbi:MAG: 16S rRNA (guanine(527)-N(7))-methyltransferase RsmG [Lachnospiraceae bacterium]|nr:16S rRNA (guanine(527)-N(7))-methyltransferase RsmG [Lachnospiraceae bacterium]